MALPSNGRLRFRPAPLPQPALAARSASRREPRARQWLPFLCEPGIEAAPSELALSGFDAEEAASAMVGFYAAYPSRASDRCCPAASTAAMEVDACQRMLEVMHEDRRTTSRILGGSISRGHRMLELAVLEPLHYVCR
jgi:hypothetical protein